MLPADWTSEFCAEKELIRETELGTGSGSYTTEQQDKHDLKM